MTKNTTLPEPTDKELLLEQIEDAEDYYEQTGNLWAKYAVVTLRAELKKWFGDDGEEIPVTNPVTNLNVQFSPAEALDAEGWQTVYPKGFGRLPKWARSTDPSAGLDISRSRSNGCFIIRNEREIANAWVNDPREAANSISRRRASPRVCLLAGTMLQGWRYMFPTYNFKGAYDTLQDYAFDPDIPFNDDEKEAFKTNFVAYHMSGGALLGAHLQRYGNVTFNGEHVDPSGKHRILTVVNHPQWILPGAMEHWNSHLFIRKTYHQAQRKAAAIDEGAARIPGYTSPEQWGGGDTRDEWRRWRAKREVHGRRGLPFSQLLK